jgi:bifunctional DNA-binding transcriptional regulator/antitoxin component of YhaV-PrlF toxin-antitoxin module
VSAPRPGRPVSGREVAHDLARVADHLQIAGDDFIERRPFREGNLDNAVARRGVLGRASFTIALESKENFPYVPRGGHVMNTLTVTTKGQVTLRRDLLKHLGVQPGEKIIVDKLPEGRIEIKASRPTGKISDVFDFLKRENGPSFSIEEINEVARRGWAGKR